MVPDHIGRALSRLSDAVGAAGLRRDEAVLALMGGDIFCAGGRPLAVVRPTGVAGLQAAVRVCSDHGLAMTPRGGGASYSAGYLLEAGGHVVLDTSGLLEVKIDAANAVVEVGAGATWAALREVLAPLGLRTPFWGPFSGLVATIGGSLSQTALSHGSGAHGTSAQSVLSIDVVLANGELLRTSAAPASRHFGPDLTGLFCGDCGALGVKVSARLPLMTLKPAFEGLSFAFDDFDAFAEAGRLAQMEGLDDEHFGLDRALSQGQIGRTRSSAAKRRVAADVWRAAPNPIEGLRALTRVAAGALDQRTEEVFTWHFLVDGVDDAEAKAKSRRLRALLGRRGREAPNAVPTYVRAVPFAPLVNALGPAGERWTPLHGVLRHAETPVFHKALTALYAEHKADMDRLGVWTGAMFSPVGQAGFLYETAIYWPDRRLPFHDASLDPGHLASVPAYDANPEGAALVERLKRDVVGLFAEHGAAHFQVGRLYPLMERLDAPAASLLRTVKRALDPTNLMNPGVLGL